MPPQIKEVEVGNLDDDRPPKHSPSHMNEGWCPDLNPTQQKIFDDPARFLLAHGEKGSGKSISLGHKDIRHAYENDNALVLLVSPSIRTGNEGIWHDLTSMILPQWKDGFGLEHSDSKLDPNTKDRHIWVGNRFGGWSKILLMSIPHASMANARIKGPAPSFVHVEEITDCEGREYFTGPNAQVGRRRGIAGPQQFVASCNAKGPSHWVYKIFFEESILENGQRDPRYSVYHVPIQENIHRLPPDYINDLFSIYKHDPIQLRRLLHGEWIDMPTGKAIFKDDWRADFHVRGDLARKLFIHPIPGFPIDIGYDPGPVNFAVSFQQTIPTVEGKLLTIIFDEINHVGTPTKYKVVVGEILRRMDFWDEVTGHDFNYEHIADEAAFNQARSDGRFDFVTIQDASIDPETGYARIILKACPKGADSVPAAIRMIQAMLQEEELIVSAKCVHTKDSFENLESENVPEGKYDPHAGYRPRRSKYIHQMDALRYAMLRRRLRGVVSEEQAIKPQVYAFG